MNRAIVPARWALAALLALGTCASVASAQVVRDLTDLKISGTRATDDLHSLRIVVGDGTAVLPGVRLHPPQGDSAFVLETDARGSVALDVPQSFDALRFRVVDQLGRTWVVDHPLQSGAPLPTEVVVELGAQGAKVRTFGPEPTELAEHAQVLDQLLENGPVLNDDEALQGPVPARQTTTPVLATGRTGVDLTRRTSPDLDPADWNSTTGSGEDALSGGIRSGVRRGWTPGDSSIGNPLSMAWSGETEPNDTPGECNMIDAADFGSTLVGQDLSSRGDNDWFCFQASCGDVISFTATPVGAPSLRPRLEMYFDDGTVQGASLRRNFGSNGVASNLTEVAPMTTTYWVLVRDGGFSSGHPYSYELQVDVTPGTCPDVNDPGEATWGLDDPPGCNTVLVPTAPGSFDDSRAITWHGYRPFPNVPHMKDKDSYCVSLDCGERLIVTMTPTGDMTLAPEIILYAPGTGDFDPVSARYPTPFAWETGIAGQPLTAVIEPAAAGGLWRVELSARDSSSSPTTGTYDVSISRDTGFDCVVDEPNDDPTECNPVVAGTLYENVMYPASDTDFACFDVPACGTLVSVQTRVPPGLYNVGPTDIAETTVAVFDPTGAPIRGNLAKGDQNQASVSFVAPMPGTYVARVMGTRNTPPAAPSDVITGRYDLLVTLVDGTSPLLVPVTETESPTETVLSAQANAESRTGSVAPGPGAVDLVVDGNNLQGVPLPFTFNFYGQPKSDIWIGDDGIVQFESGFSTFPAQDCLPNAFSPNDAIYAFWDDFETRNSYAGDPTSYDPLARKTYETVGTAPNREFVVTWYRMPLSGGWQGNLAGRHDFKVTLHEGTDCIELEYGEMSGSRSSNGKYATIGLENADATKGMNFSCFEQKVEAGLTVTYCPDGSGGYTESVSRATPDLAAYPDTTSCQYDVGVDSAPFEDISGTGDLVDTWVKEYQITDPSCPWWDPTCAPLGFAPNPDENYAFLSLPFPFPYHGLTETDVAVDINGMLWFDSAPHPNGTFHNRCDQPETSDLDGKVMAFWDSELAFQEIGFFPNISWDGGVYTEHVPGPGVGDDKFIVQWTNANTFLFGGGPDTRVTFQAILHESGDIQFHYGNMGGVDPNPIATGYQAQVGLEDRTGTKGTIYWCNDSGSNFGHNRFQGPLVSDHRVTFSPSTAGAAFEWTDADTGDLLGSTADLTIPVEADMPCSVELQVTARDPKQCCDNVFSDTLVTDRWAPDVSVALSPDCLWSPNHKTVELSVGSEIDVQAFDKCGGTTIRLVSCESNEPDNWIGDGNTENDCELLSDGSVRLRSERSGVLTGRIYSVGFEVEDENGNVTTGTMDISVPHDQSGTKCPNLANVHLD